MHRCYINALTTVIQKQQLAYLALMSGWHMGHGYNED